MNLLQRELRGGFRSLIIWSLSVGAYNFLMMSVYPAFKINAERISELMAIFPEAMIKAFGLDRLSMADPIGFYATEVYIMMILFGSIFAALLGAGILAKEEDEKTIEFLLSTPLSRNGLLLQKILAFVIILVAFNASVTMLTLIAFALSLGGTDFSLAALLRLSVAPFFAQLTFASIGFLAALFLKRRRSVYSFSIGLAIGSYFVGMISLMAERFAWLRWLSPTRYIEAVDIVTEGLNLGYLAILTGASAAALITAYILYRRRDITV